MKWMLLMLMGLAACKSGVPKIVQGKANAPEEPRGSVEPVRDQGVAWHVESLVAKQEQAADCWTLMVPTGREQALKDYVLARTGTEHEGVTTFKLAPGECEVAPYKYECRGVAIQAGKTRTTITTMYFHANFHVAAEIEDHKKECTEAGGAFTEK